MRTTVTFIFDEGVPIESRLNSIRDFMNGCEEAPYFLEDGTQHSNILFDPSDNKGFYRVGTWVIDTIEEEKHEQNTT